MTLSLAVVHPANAAVNLGRFSVALAGVEFFQSLGIPAAHVVMQHPFASPHFATARTRFSVVTDVTTLEPFDAVCFWGDFTTSPSYGAEEFARQDVLWGMSPEPLEAFERWQQFFLRPARPSQRLLSVGQNHMGVDTADAPAIQDLAAAYARFDLFAPRDTRSRRDLRKLLDDHEHAPRPVIMQGMDCSFLLGAPRRVRRPARPPEHAMLALGRSFVSEGPRILDAMRRTGLTVHGGLGRWLDAPPRETANYLDLTLEPVLTTDLLVTDIYHLAVDALRCGTPVVLLARPARAQLGVTGEAKKLQLMRDLGLEDRLIVWEEGSSTADATLLEGLKRAAGLDSRVLAASLDRRAKDWRAQLTAIMRVKLTAEQAA